MLFVAAAAGESTAMDIHQNGQLIAFTGGVGGEDVQKQAVFVVGIGLALAELIVIENLLQVLFFIVKGPGEAKEADIGIAGGIGEGLLIKKGEIIKKVPESELLSTLREELLNWNK